MSDFDDLRRRESIQPPPTRQRAGLWRAIVHDNNDPAKRGRLRVIIPEVSGEGAPHPKWAWPASGLGARGKSASKKWGDLWLPENGDVVAIEFVGGDPDEPAWLPGWFLEGAVPELLLTHYPNRRGLVSPSGHALYFDDSDGADGEVKLAHRDGAVVRFSGAGEALFDAKPGALAKIQGGGAAAAREGDAVQVTIPPGTVVVDVVNGAAVKNADPITLDGTIVGPCSTKTQIG